MNDKMLKMLHRSFDEPLTPAEKQYLEDALKQHRELREEKERIGALREKVAHSGSQAFKPFFAERVMQRISRSEYAVSGQETFWDSLVAMFRPIAIGAAIILVVIMTYNIKKSDHFSLAAAFASQELTLEDATDPTLSLAMELSK
ncbi:MAG TPA: hypothetical protein ENH29_06170 [Bacteroidetes bacterium]|nr:hypothetical protein [Bacteroidota bacterium]